EPVLVGRGNPLTVRAHGYAPDPAHVAAEREQFLAGLDVPDLHRIMARGGKAMAVTAEYALHDNVRVTDEGTRRSFGRQVPDRQVAVLARRDQALSLRVEGNSEHGARVILEGPQSLSGRRVPELDGPIDARRGQACTVRTERHTMDPGIWGCGDRADLTT